MVLGIVLSVLGVVIAEIGDKYIAKDDRLSSWIAFICGFGGIGLILVGLAMTLFGCVGAF